MRNKTTLLGLGLLLMFSLGATLFSRRPPATYTGAPSESNCTSCHAAVVNAGTGLLSLSLPTAYASDSTYTIMASLTDTAAAKFGFELTALDSFNLFAGDFTATQTNTARQFGNVGGQRRQYMSHFFADTNQTWQFDWTAPSIRSGPVTFYMAGNGANNDRSNNNDNIYTHSFVLNPLPEAGFSLGQDTLCVGESLLVADSSGGATQYLWDFGAGATPATDTTAGPHSVTYSSTGSKLIRLIVQSPLGADTL
ncbi:MAG: hypothetical protein KAG66_09470, partial [Methylococcales bacterium]|nr:hypothetical protein [Methylococcales bacterium]